MIIHFLGVEVLSFCVFLIETVRLTRLILQERTSRLAYWLERVYVLDEWGWEQMYVGPNPAQD